jgi:hypothetical protein
MLHHDFEYDDAPKGVHVNEVIVGNRCFVLLSLEYP